MREIPHSPVALYEVAHLFGTLIAETILASVHVRACKQAGHMGASDLIKALQNTLRGGGRPHTGNVGPIALGQRLDAPARFADAAENFELVGIAATQKHDFFRSTVGNF